MKQAIFEDFSVAKHGKVIDQQEQQELVAVQIVGCHKTGCTDNCEACQLDVWELTRHGTN